MTLRTLLADDEPLARERLKFLLAADPDIGIVSECKNAKEVVAALKASQVDLLFLDIQMPGDNGFEVIEQVGQPHMPLTVFVTAHNEHAVEAFKVRALDYLIKPVEPARLNETLRKVKERLQQQAAFLARQEISSALEVLRLASAAEPRYPERFLARNGNSSSVVFVSDIEWIEAADYYVCLHAGGKKHLLRESIKALENKLNPEKFIRLHRSVIVNLDYVREIHRDGRSEGWVLLSTGERVRLNKAGWHKLLTRNAFL